MVHEISRINDDDQKTPRGFMLRVSDISFWSLCSMCFSSIPSSHLDKEEVWFTSNHTHDIGSVAHSWKYAIPFS